MTDLLLRNVEVAGVAGLDVRIANGLVASIGRIEPDAEEVLEGGGGALIPGLADHHVHLLATAARLRSVDLEEARDREDLLRRLSRGLSLLAPGAWLRATGYHEHRTGPLTLEDLDAVSPAHPLRVQHQTGAVWLLNSAALARLGPDLPEGAERDERGRPTGRLWRADAWLRERIGADPPPLAALGRELTAAGVTHLTDATVTTDAAAAALLAHAHRRSELPQRLLLMSAGALAAPVDGAFAVGPLKIVPDERELPSLDDMAGRIMAARDQGRAVAVHCVTAVELAITLAAFDAAGVRDGDRVEHGAVVDVAAIGELRRLGLTVVTQPGFILDRGERFLAETPRREHGDLYRCASLIEAGVRVAGSSDAPYGPVDPWAGIRAAIGRRTRNGEVVTCEEGVEPSRALALWLGPQGDPGGAPRRVAVGEMADLCLLRAPLAEVLRAPAAEAVAATLVGGRIVYRAS